MNYRAQKAIVGRISSRPGETNLRPPLMPHAERQALIHAPITFRVIERKTHAGTLIVRELPTEGRRRPAGHAIDESFYGYTTDDVETFIDMMSK